MDGCTGARLKHTCCDCQERCVADYATAVSLLSTSNHLCYITVSASVMHVIVALHFPVFVEDIANELYDVGVTGRSNLTPS